MARAVALSCRTLSKEFLVADGGNAWRLLIGRAAGLPHVRALCDIDIMVPKGEFVGIIGRNGAGKSTLLRTLGGAYEPTTGTIRREPDLAALYELGAAGNVDLTGLGYARRYLEITGTPRRKIPGLVEEIAEFSELGERIRDSLKTYSAGMKARLFFGCATAEEHDLYLIDEVLSVGDAHFQAKCWRRIRERLTRGASGVLVTHDWGAVLKLCETTHILDKGRIVASGSSPDVVQKYLRSQTPEAEQSGSAGFADLPEAVTWEQGATVGVDLTVWAEEERPLKVVFAVEKLVKGFGWEIVLNGIDLPLPTFRGRRNVRLTIPDMPLAPGNYMLAIALVEVSPRDPTDRVIHQAIGWLSGSPIPVTVSGPETAGTYALPGNWSVAAS